MGRTKLSVVIVVIFVVKCFAMTYDELEDFAEHIKKTSQLSPTLKKGVDPDDYDEDEVVSDHAWEESGKFEGDLILNERQRRLIVEDVAEGLSRNGIRDGSKRWPNNEVIYYIQVEHFTGDQVQAIENGIEDLARASCVKFRPYKKGDRDAVVIQGSRRGCFSQVGYQGGYQVLNLSGRHPVGRGCFRHGTVIHELLHTLGFYHMQSSPDRDDYVDIIWSNIVQPARHNFRKYNSFSVSDFGVGYDYDSVLHYSRRAFSANGQDTIVPKQGGAEIGQRVGLSDKDTQKLNKMYCDADSDSGQADEDSSKKTLTKKNKAKNKPFEGHGIGYHQGKAVAIKLLPAAETYKLPDVPSFHVFDYFSKEPQILPTSESEGFYIGKEITYSYNPADTLTTSENNTPANINSGPENKTDNSEITVQMQNADHNNVAEVKVNHPKETQISDSNTTSDLYTHDKINRPDKEKLDTDVLDAFDRLSKIIKLHVYPSQPNLSVHKVNEPFINHYSPSEIKVDSDKFVLPTKINKWKEDKMSSAIKFINDLYDFSADKYLPNKQQDRKDEKIKYEQLIKDIQNASVTITPEGENRQNHISAYTSPFPSNKNHEDEYVSKSGYESPEHYQGKIEYTNIFTPKIVHNHDKPSENKDEWHQKYNPYSGHDYLKDYYTDYLKDSSKETHYDDKSNENIYSSSIPIKKQEYSVFNVPAQMIKGWQIKDTSDEEM